MYLGIDLGTSNSAIVGNDGGALRHFKSVDGMDVLPSAIMVDKRGSMMIGKRAYDQAAFSPENVAQGFKRLLGTSSELRFSSSEKVLTPEEASAEIIKALIAQARLASGGFDIKGAVVTIPAAFNQMQSEATMRAAVAGGIERVALLHEPIAAAMASIASSANKQGQFLVYDLGGGTFDAAIVQTINGSATVIGHTGINMLGGRDFDRSLVNAVVRPWLDDNFDLQNASDKEKQRLFRVAQYRAELSKIALSTQITDRIFADESQINLRDDNGKEMFIDVEISRTQLEGLVSEDIDRSVEACRALIDECGFVSTDIDRVVLIGGPSRMPIVKQRLQDALAIRTDLTIDPMTAVATGAAIFAESRDWSAATQSGSTRPKKAREAKAAEGTANVRYEFTARTSDEKVRIRVLPDKPNGKLAGLKAQADNEDGWTSGLVDLAENSEIRDVPLSRIGSNTIRVRVYDEAGVQVALTSLTVIRTQASAAGMPMTHNLAVKVLSAATGFEQNALDTIVKKGTLLPKTGIERFRAARNFRAGDGSHLDFEVFEQADGVDDPLLNLAVGSFRISSNDLGKGDVIRKGDNVFVHWSIDENGLLDCNLELPSISQTYNTGKMFVSTEGHKSFDGEDGIRITSEFLLEARSDIEELQRTLGGQVSGELIALNHRLAKQQDLFRLSHHEPETLRSISEECRLLRQDVARLRGRPEFLSIAIRSDVDDFAESFSDLSSEIEEKTRTQIIRLLAHARDSLSRTDPNSITEAHRSFGEMRALLFSDLAKRPGFWVSRFRFLAEERHLAIDKHQHDRFVADGERAIQSEDFDTLRSLTFSMTQNRFRIGGNGSSDGLAGLMRG